MNEHNPIMLRIDEMVQVWKKLVLPHHTLIRWMLKPEDSRMYEGFCRLEASPHGKLDNLFLFFFTPFASLQTFSFDIITNWLQEYDDPKQRQQMIDAGIQELWELSAIRNAIDEKNYTACDALLPLMLQSYRNWVGMPDTPIVLSLLPKQMSAPQHFLQWIAQWMEQSRPAQTQLLVYDHQDANHWGKIFERHHEVAVSLHHDLRMQDAIRQIATAGANHDPYAFFRKCMFEMGDAASRKNKPLLHDWGEKAIEAGKKSGDKTLLATAYITFAGMLFSFKDHPRIHQLLDTGMRLCKQAVDNGDESLKSLLLQYYTYKGADFQLQKERKEALQWFMKAGDEAAHFGFASQAVSSYYKAFVFAEYKNMQEAKELAVNAALQLTDRLTAEEVQSSEYPFMAHDYILRNKGDLLMKEKVEKKMVEAFDEDWQSTVLSLKENYTKKKIRQAREGLTEGV
jgi:hypothetical protein